MFNRLGRSGCCFQRPYRPLPDRRTVCGLLAALSVKVSVPVIEPEVVGEKVTPTTQLAPAAIPAPQVLLSTAKPVLAEMPAKLSAAFKRLVTVTVRAALVPPTAMDPNVRLLDERLTGALPVPERLTFWVPASSDIVIAPEAEPIAVGVKVTRIVHAAPGIMLPTQVLV